jgi:antitoxin CcdA
MAIYDHSAPKRPVNLSINSDLAKRARSAGVNLSAVAEDAIGRAFAAREAERFAAEIAAGVAHHEAYLAEYGSLSDAVRAATEGDD